MSTYRLRGWAVWGSDMFAVYFKGSCDIWLSITATKFCITTYHSLLIPIPTPPPPANHPPVLHHYIGPRAIGRRFGPNPQNQHQAAGVTLRQGESLSCPGWWYLLFVVTRGAFVKFPIINAHHSRPNASPNASRLHGSLRGPIPFYRFSRRVRQHLQRIVTEQNKVRQSELEKRAHYSFSTNTRRNNTTKSAPPPATALTCPPPTRLDPSPQR